MIRITSKRNGFRRCGVPFYREPIGFPDDRFTKKELKILNAEPMLTVEAMEEVKSVEPIEPAEAAESIESIEPVNEVDDLLEAARKAIEADNVTKDGKPTVEAIEEILGRNISAKDRDEAWEKFTESKPV